MIADVDKYIDFLCQHELSEYQFLILWLVYTKDINNIKKYKQVKGDFCIHDIEYLIECGFINDFGIVKDNHRDYNIHDFIVTDKFTKVVVVDEEDAYEQLISVYPKWINVKGRNFPTVTGDPYKLGKEYFKYHKGNRIAHERVLDITKRYFQNNPAFGKLENYILNRQWNLLEEKVSQGDAFKRL